MNKSANAIEAQVNQATAETVNGESGSGLKLPPFNAENARAVLEWLRQGLPQEQETFEHLTEVLSENLAAATGDSVTASEIPGTKPVSNGTSERSPNFVLPPFDPEGMIALLRSLRQGD